MNNCFRLFLFLVVILSVTSSVFGQAPGAPTGLTIVHGLFGTAVLHWDSASGADWYRVYRAVDDGAFRKIGETPRRIFLDVELFPHQKYFYYVTGMNGSGEGLTSDTVLFQLDHFPPPPVSGVIQGTVTDSSTGLPLKNAEVEFFNLRGLWSIPMHTDSGGNYSARLDTGNYILLAKKLAYYPLWYNGTHRLDSATVVTVQQDSVFSANFSLPPIPPPTFSNVTGTVIDSITGQPLRNAAVFFMRPYREFRHIENEIGTIGGLLAERLDYGELGRLHGVVWAGLTDSNGGYTAQVQTGLRYVAMAYKPGFLPRFYNNKATYFHANVIHVTGDTSGIDFDLLPLLPTGNSLSGDVQDTSGVGVPSHVLLFRHSPAGYVPVRYQMTDSAGNYDFRNIIAGGTFIIKAYPIDGFAPAWYSASGCGVRNWHNADTVHVSGAVSAINICVMPAPEGGFSTITGQINTPGQLPGSKRAVTMASSPVDGVSVFAISTVSNAVLAVDVTAPDGSFSLENLPSGSYTLEVDKEGYSSSSGTPSVTVDESNNYQNSGTVVNVTPDIVNEVKNTPPALPSAFRLDQNYPNPFNPTTQIRFALPVQSSVSLKVYNLIGQQIAVLLNEVRGAGIHAVEWNGSDSHGQQLGSGIYFVKMIATPLAGGNQSPFSETRKMILLK